MSIVLHLENSSSPFSDPAGVSSLEKPSGIVPVRSCLWCPDRRCALSRAQELVPALGRSWPNDLGPESLALLESQLCPSCCVTQEKHSPLSLSLLFCKMGTNIPPGQVRPKEGWRKGLPGCDPWMQGAKAGPLTARGGTRCGGGQLSPPYLEVWLNQGEW